MEVFWPVAVVVVFVVASERGEATQTDGVREKDLRACVHPHLKTQEDMLWFLKQPHNFNLIKRENTCPFYL